MLADTPFIEFLDLNPLLYKGEKCIITIYNIDVQPKGIKMYMYMYNVVHSVKN